MANTKSLDRSARKQVKREKRREFKSQLGELTQKERRELRKYEGTKSAFMRELEARKNSDA